MKNLKYFLNKAITDNFALGAFNFSNLTTLQAILQACKELSSPAIISVSESALNFLGEKYVMSITQTAKEEFPYLFLHLDHGKDFEICKKAIDLGFDSVMIDGSSKSYLENIELTKKVCSYAHEKGILVEGELGQIKGIEDDINSQENNFTNPMQAKDFVEKTEVDSLAVAIGTSHGAYKYSGKQQLKFDILEQIETLMPCLPLVLHGASTVDNFLVEKINNFGGNIQSAIGISKNDIQKAVQKYNIAKINTDTDLRLALTGAIRQSLIQNKGNFDPRKYLGEGKELICQVVKDKIQNLFYSFDKI